MNDAETIYVDQDGYNQLLSKLKSLQDELSKNNAEKAYAYENSGDGWHDNFAFEEANRIENMLLGQIDYYHNIIANAVIVEKEDRDDIVDIGDIVDISTKVNGEILPDYSFQLVANAGNPLDLEVPKISINSPLGSAVYHKKVGDSSNYKVDEKLFEVVVLSKKKETKQKSK